MEVNQRLERVLARIPPEYVSNVQVIQNALSEPEKQPTVLWVTSPTGKPHIGYLVPLLKHADFVEANVKVKIVILDTYSFLDNVDYPMEQVAHRAKYYQLTMAGALESLGVETSNIEFITESSYQSPQFIRDLWKLCAMTPQQEVKDSWDRAIHPEMVSPLMCPLLQLLSEEYLDVDFQFGGHDQGSIFNLIDKYAPRLGHRPRGHLMNPMLPSLPGNKMSASNPESTKILLLDSSENIKAKLSGTAWQTDLARNIFLASIKEIFVPLSELHSRPTAKVVAGWVNPAILPNAHAGTVFSIHTESSGPVHFDSFTAVRRALMDGSLASDDVKESVISAFVALLEPMRRKRSESAEFAEAEAGGYPVVG